MPLRKYKPITAGTRWRIGNAYTEITTNKPEKSLLESTKSTAGRNVQGRRSMRYMGGGHKKMYRLVDFKRDKKDIPAVVASIEYDPHRTAFIALLNYVDGEKRYIIAPQGLKVGQKIISAEKVEIEIGNAAPLGTLPIGANVHNIELTLGRGGQLARSAGSFAIITGRDGEYTIVDVYKRQPHILCR